MRSLLLLMTVLSLTVGAAPPIIVRDDYSREVRLEAPATRVVSLAPHLTELLYAAGAGGHVVGAVAHSDFPPEANALPTVGSSTGIDLEAILALRPDLIVAWPDSSSERTLARLAALGLPVYRSEPRALEDIARTLERLGQLTGSAQAAAVSASAFRARVIALERRYAERAPVRVFYEVWDRPLMTVNGQHVISKVLRLCGGRNVFAELPVLAPSIDREAVLRANPEVIVGSAPQGSRPAWLDAWNAYPGLSAAARGNLYAIAPELIQRHTPRLLDGAEHLCAILDEARAKRGG